MRLQIQAELGRAGQKRPGPLVELIDCAPLAALCGRVDILQRERRLARTGGAAQQRAGSPQRPAAEQGIQRGYAARHRITDEGHGARPRRGAETRQGRRGGYRSRAIPRDNGRRASSRPPAAAVPCRSRASAAPG